MQFLLNIVLVLLITYIIYNKSNKTYFNKFQKIFKLINSINFFKPKKRILISIITIILIKSVLFLDLDLDDIKSNLNYNVLFLTTSGYSIRLDSIPPDFIKCLQLSIIDFSSFIFRIYILFFFIFEKGRVNLKETLYSFINDILEPVKNLIYKTKLNIIRFNENLNCILIFFIIFVISSFIISGETNLHNFVNLILLGCYNFIKILDLIILIIILKIIFDIIKIKNIYFRKIINEFTAIFCMPLKQIFNLKINRFDVAPLIMLILIWFIKIFFNNIIYSIFISYNRSGII